MNLQQEVDLEMSSPEVPLALKRGRSPYRDRSLANESSAIEPKPAEPTEPIDPKSRAYLLRMATSPESPFFRILGSPLEAVSSMDGRDVVMLGANNYLGLTTDPRVTAAAVNAICCCGTGCTGSRLMNGTSLYHLELENRLARFFRKEAALVFSAGFLANLGVLSALGTRETYFVSDKLNHASICDGLLASFAQCLRFNHNDPDSLRQRLRKIPGAAPKWVIVEGVHSMMGDVCPLPEIVAVAREFGARVIVDDAHGVGVLGEGGRGTAHLFGVEDEVDVVTGTFSKSFASYGGFAVGDRAVIEQLRFGARAFIFTASLPPANVATVLKVLDILEEEPQIVGRLRRKTLDLARRLHAASLVQKEPPAAILPLILGPNDLTWKAWRLIYEAGVYTNAAFPPGTPAGQALIRISMMASMPEDAIAYAARVIIRTFDALGVRPC
jgi:8-amino-7-oxononanoate synthase